MEIEDVSLVAHLADRSVMVTYDVNTHAWASGTWVIDTVHISGPGLSYGEVTLSSDPWQIPVFAAGEPARVRRSTGSIRLPDDLEIVVGRLEVAVEVEPQCETGAAANAAGTVAP